MVEILPLFAGMPGGPELIVIFLIIILLFGANKLPKLARSSGEAMGEFKKGREEVEQELQEIQSSSSTSTDTTTDTATNTSPEDEVPASERETETETETETEGTTSGSTSEQ